jgi:hypothetical protein
MYSLFSSRYKVSFWLKLFKLEIQLALRPRSLALFKAGSRIAASMAMMAITTSNSIKVKRVLDFLA